MCRKMEGEYSLNAMANGHNLNALRLLTGYDNGRKGHRLTEVKFQFKRTTVLIIVKKDSPKGPMVGFLEGNNLDDALYVLASAIKTKQIKWKPDKFRSMRSDKT